MKILKASLLAFIPLHLAWSGEIRWQDLPHTNPAQVIPDTSILIPSGTSYQDQVPDTLDLAEVAKAYIQGMSRTLIASHAYVPPGHVVFFGQAHSEVVGGAPNWGKAMSGLILARRMSGYDLDNHDGTLSVQMQSLRNMIDPNVNIQFINGPPPDAAWIVQPNPNITPMSVALESLIELQRQSPSPALEQIIRQMVAYHTATQGAAAQIVQQGQESMMYYGSTNETGDFSPNFVGVSGRYLTPFINGKAMRALSAWSLLSNDMSTLDPVKFLSSMVLDYNQGLFWQTTGNVPAGYGHFAGHEHGFLNATMGLLWGAEVRLKQDPKDTLAHDWIRFAQATYLFVRDFNGAGALGDFGEICTVGDMLRIAVKLTELGAGDYNEDIDRWLRNQMAEAQIREHNPIPDEPHPQNELLDHVGSKVVGLFFEDAAHPFAIPNDPSNEGVSAFQLVACGLGNAIMGIFDAWVHIIQVTDHTVQVNLLLNRTSPILDIKSELPYRGRVDIVTKASLGAIDTLKIRIPDWTNKAKLQVLLNGVSLPANQWNWSDSAYIQIQSIKSNSVYSVVFPMVVRSMTVAQMKSQSQMWTESDLDDPSHPFTIQTYSAIFRGNTLVSVDHRPSGGVQLYQRQALAGLQSSEVPAPTVVRARFAAERLP